MIFKSFIITCLSLLIFNTAALCEYYQYVDEKGIKHFTDNILEVPEDQRKQISIHESVQSAEEAAPPSENQEEETPAEILIRLREELSREYTELTQKKEDFEKLDQNTDPEAYNTRADQLTTEIEAYNKKYKDYEKRLSEFNSRSIPIGPETDKETEETETEEAEPAEEDLTVEEPSE